MTHVTISESGDFTCICGNNTNLEGAYPCDKQGTLVEPAPDEWPDQLYRCDRCGTVFNGETGEINTAVETDTRFS
jgi:hypothetical protein